MALQRDERDQQLRSSVSSDDLHLENIFDDNGVSGQLLDDMVTLERRLSALSLGPAGCKSVAELQQAQVRSSSARSCRHSGPAASQRALRSATAGPDSQVVVREGRP